MTPEPLRNLRSVLLEQFSKLWGYDAAKHQSLIVPEPLREHVDLVHKDSVPSEVVDEVLSHLGDDAGEVAINHDESGTLPLVARLRPRGHYEDDWRAQVSSQHPWPVVLIHGTGATTGDWQELAAQLRAEGWAVFAPAYGTRATGPIEDSAAEVGAYIETVLSSTGSEKAILVGHSQGGLVARFWMQCLGGADRVHHLISLAAPHHGTTLGGIISPLITSKPAAAVVDSFVQIWFGPAGFQQVVGSPVVEAVNAHGDTDPRVDGYTCIATRSDSVIQPPETCFLKGDNVSNLWVQTAHPHAVVLHEDMPHDRRVRRLVVAALRQIASQSR